MNTRILTIDFENADSETRIAPAVLSTETPVFRKQLGANEILRHDQDSVDLSRSPLPLIESHDASKTPIGIVENIEVMNGKLRGMVRMGESERAKELWDDIKSGILRSLSIGYEILSGDYVKGDYIVNRFRPYEASLVSVPADINAGLFRSNQILENTMEEENNNNAIKAERNRVSEIRALGLRHDKETLADDAITAGQSLEGFRSQLLDTLNTDKPLATPFVKQVGDANRTYSVKDAIIGLEDVTKRGYEFEISQDLERGQSKTSADSVLVPMERTMTAGTAGASTIQSTVDPMIRDFIQAKSIAYNLGMQEMNGLEGDVTIPVASSASGTTVMVTDGTTQSAETTPTLANKTLSPTYLADVIPVSYKFLQQSTPDIEQYLRRLIGQTFASKVDQQVIAGSGSSGQIDGYLSASGIGAVTYTSAPTFANLVSALETLGAANVEINNLSWVINPANISDLVTAVKYTSTASPLMDLQSEVDNQVGRTLGYRTFSTTNMTSGSYLVGDFSTSILGGWGGLEISRNPFYDDRRFSQSFNALLPVGMAIVQPTAFVKLTT
ncbi:MAG: phage major capsid protein [Gammaproteobacteria bacterium]|nr:phage major capsid protein [Gammaproteobacteria bacterium]